MNYKLSNTLLHQYNKQRVIAVATTQTSLRGYVTAAHIREELGLTNSQLVAIRDDLLADGTIEEVPE